MEYLFDSKGNHIANLVNGHLHDPSGQNIGHFLSNEKILIDMRGKYLGEIVQGNRLLFNKTSPYLNVNFGHTSPDSSGSRDSIINRKQNRRRLWRLSYMYTKHPKKPCD